MALRDISSSRIHDCGAHPPESYYRRRVTVEGDVVVEKCPALPYEKIVDAAGNVRRIPLSQGAAQRSTQTDVAARARAKALEAGAVMYGQCLFFGSQYEPGAVPADLIAKGAEHFGCTHAKSRSREIGAHKACACVEDLIKRRQGESKRKEQIAIESRKSAADRAREAQMKRDEAIARKVQSDLDREDRARAAKPDDDDKRGRR